MIMHDADSEYVAQHAKQQLDRMRAEFTGNKQTLKCICKLSPTDKSAQA